MGQSCCRNSAIPDLDVKLNSNIPQQFSIEKQQDIIPNNSQSYQTRINELENNVQISLEVFNKLNYTLQNLAVQVESLNKQLEQKQKLEQIDTNEEK